MPRPRKRRCVYNNPEFTYFKPRGVPVAHLEEIVLAVEELEAIRLRDIKGLKQKEASKEMNVSRSTYQRVLGSARKKIAEALINGKAVRIKGGDFVMGKRKFTCSECGNKWEIAHGANRPSICPKCESANFHRSDDDRGYARRGRGFRGNCGRNQ